MKLDRNFWILLAVFGAMLSAIIIMGISLHNMRYDLKISEHNYNAAKSEVVKMETKNKELIYEKEALILSEEQLREELGLSKKELKEINKKIESQAVYIAKLESAVKIDTVETRTDSIIYVDNTPAFVKFRMDDEWIQFNGKSDISKKSTTISDLNIPVPLEVGVSKDYSIFVLTPNPYLDITDINAVAVSDFVKKIEKKKHWGVGISLGVSVQYGLVHKKFDVGPGILVGFEYKF